MEKTMADGTFGPASQKAFGDYQTANKLKATGLPDPLTLFLLLQKPK